MSTFDSFVSSQRDRMLEELKALLRIPSISTDPSHNADCRRAAEWIGNHLKQLGCPKVEYLASETHPIVWAEGPAAPGKPTVIVYGHYDVQPPDPLAEWTTPPFEPTVRAGDIFARGATDDKGQVFAVIKAFEAVLAQGAPPVNVKFIIEGQEEAGSKILFDLLAKQPELVRGDAVLVSDTPFYAKGVPSVETGLRGLCYAEIQVRTSKTDLHSGLYGGAAPNAHETLVRILAALKSADGRIRIPGLYEAVERPSKKVRDGWAKLPFNERKFLREEVGAKALAGLKQYTVLERLWALPTFEIHGIMGGFTGEGSKTVIPAVATAKVSLRLVPKLTEKKVLAMLTKAAKAAAPAYAEVTVKSLHGANPVVVDVESRPIAIMSQAFKDVMGKGVVLTRSGGSIPIVPELGKAGAPVVLSGIGLPDDRLHAPNEKINLDQVWMGVKVFGRFFQLMGNG